MLDMVCHGIHLFFAFSCRYNARVSEESTVTVECNRFSIRGEKLWFGQCDRFSDFFMLIRDGARYEIACGSEFRNEKIQFKVKEWMRIWFQTDTWGRGRGWRCYLSTEADSSSPVTDSPVTNPPTTDAPSSGEEICQICGLTDGNNRIVNGEDATKGQHPWQVRISMGCGELLSGNTW